MYDKFTFRNQTQANNLVAPLCHLFVGTRFTQYKGAAKAFSALSDAVGLELWDIFQKTPQHFNTRPTAPTQPKQFDKRYCVDVRDFNTAGVVAAHLGILLRNLKGGTYEVHGTEVDVNGERVTECVSSITAILKHL